MACCLAKSCNIVFIVDERCYHVECVSDELCLPLPRPNSRKWNARLSMILVKPVLTNGISFLFASCTLSDHLMTTWGRWCACVRASTLASVRTCVHANILATIRACERAFERAFVRACMRACVYACTGYFYWALYAIRRTVYCRNRYTSKLSFQSNSSF